MDFIKSDERLPGTIGICGRQDTVFFLAEKVWKDVRPTVRKRRKNAFHGHVVDRPV